MDPFLIFLTVVISVLTLLMTIVGVYVIIILRQLQQSLTKLNRLFDLGEHALGHLAHPFGDMRAVSQGVKTGLTIADQVVGWLKKKAKEEA